METTRRSIAKALSWQGIGLLLMTGIGYVFTGSIGQGGMLAIVSSAIGLLSYVLHERLWARVRWGRTHADQVPVPHR